MKVVGRYRIYEEFAAGGMASIHFGKLGGEGGFSRLVAIKRMHPQFTRDLEFVNMFMDEARVAGRIQHPNVVSVIDVIRSGDELLLVMDYVHGESLSRLQKQLHDENAKTPPEIAARLVVDLLHGLHAAHEATGEFGAPLGIVHRDVSPHNLLVGIDGIARVVDFGIAKAHGRIQETVDGSIRGKLAYFSPEQFEHRVDRRTDVFAAAIVLWEALCGRKLFTGDSQWEVVQAVLTSEIVDPSQEDATIPAALGAVVMRGLARDVDARFQTARDMAVAIESSLALASHSTVADWVRSLAGPALDARRQRIARSEELEPDLVPPPSVGRRPAAALPPPPRTDQAPPSAVGRRRVSMALVVIATAGATLGVAGIVLAYAMWAHDRPQADPRPTTQSPESPASSATSPGPPPPSIEISAQPMTSAEVAPVASSGRPHAATGTLPTTNPRLISPEEKACRDRKGLLCGGVCYDSPTSMHCGKCGNRCNPDQSCDGKSCVTRSCGPLLILCPGWGCVNVNGSHWQHCGACGRQCFGRCEKGVCVKP